MFLQSSRIGTSSSHIRCELIQYIYSPMGVLLQSFSNADGWGMSPAPNPLHATREAASTSRSSTGVWSGWVKVRMGGLSNHLGSLTTSYLACRFYNQILVYLQLALRFFHYPIYIIRIFGPDSQIDRPEGNFNRGKTTQNFISLLNWLSFNRGCVKV